MFKALASFWVFVMSCIKGFTNLAEAFNEVSEIAKDGATNLRKEMMMEAVAQRKALIKANGLTETEIKEAEIKEIKPAA